MSIRQPHSQRKLNQNNKITKTKLQLQFQMNNVGKKNILFHLQVLSAERREIEVARKDASVVGARL